MLSVVLHAPCRELVVQKACPWVSPFLVLLSETRTDASSEQDRETPEGWRPRDSPNRVAASGLTRVANGLAGEMVVLRCFGLQAFEAPLDAEESA